MTYTPRTDWVDLPSHATPTMAADLIRIETGIAAVEAEALAAASSAQSAASSDATSKANAAQAFAIQRGNHTGTQLMSTIRDAGTAATKNVGTTAGTVMAGDDGRIQPAYPFDIRTWAHMDGRWVSDAAMASGGSTVTSATAAFTAGDVGKLICIATQPTSGSTVAVSFAGTVATYVSATQVTVSGFTNTTGGAISGAFLALGSDETTAFQSAINAMAVAGHGGGLCYVPDGIYLLGGALSSGAQLTVPTIADTLVPPAWGFIGQTAPYNVRWNIHYSPPAMSGPIILSLQGKLSGVSAGKIINSTGGWSLMQFNLRRLAFRVLPGSNGGGLDLSNVLSIDVEDVTVEVQANVQAMPTPSGFPNAIIAPGNGNGAFVKLRNVHVVGFGVAYLLNEHSSLDDVSAYACQVGFKTGLNMNHAAYGGRIGAYWCAYSLQSTAGQPAYFNIGQLDIEDGPVSQFYTSVYHIDDTGEVLYGTIGIHKPSTGLTLAGCQGVRLQPTPLKRTAVTGTTAGTATWSQPQTGPDARKVLVYLNGYQNSTVTAQTITFLVPFVQTPYLSKDDSGGSTATTTTLTLPASMGTTKTGWITVEGY